MKSTHLDTPEVPTHYLSLRESCLFSHIIYCIHYFNKILQTHQLPHSFNLGEGKNLIPGQNLYYVEVVFSCEEKLERTTYHEFLKQTKFASWISLEGPTWPLINNVFFLSEQKYEQAHSLMEIIKKYYLLLLCITRPNTRNYVQINLVGCLSFSISQENSELRVRKAQDCVLWSRGTTVITKQGETSYQT